jgi:L-alanine-DL-glutamate epimerase-like enolase superfamily enzyme
MDARIASVERTLHWVPMVDRIRVEMERAGNYTWSEVEVIRVTSESGVTGWGETIQNYTWGRADIDERVIGRSPFDLYWDDSLGAGLQMAMLDLAGKLAGVPAHRLLGEQVRSHCPLSFWDHDMSPELYEAEARESVRLGYTCMKIKTRPWWDVRDTVQRISAATPDWFAIDADWNDFLIDASTALPVLRELEQAFPKIKIFEGPIKAADLDGNRRLRAQLRTAVAHHYGAVPPHAAVTGGYCDGFVVGGGVAAIAAAASVAETATMPIFLQMVGTGLTASLSLHLGAVLPAARWPAVTCHELYRHCLLTARIPVTGGYAAVPDGPGLGVEVDRAAVQRYRVDRAELALPRRLIRYRRPVGAAVYFIAHARPGTQMWQYFARGNQPPYERGVRTELLDDDGSDAFARLYARAEQAPVLATEPYSPGAHTCR